MDGDATSVWDSPVIWHQPADGKELTQLLNSLGVGQTGTAAEPASPVEPGVAAPDSVEPASAAPTPTDDTSDTSARDRAWWGLGGLAGGVLLAAGWMRVRSTRRRRSCRRHGRATGRRRPDDGVDQRGSVTVRPSSASRVRVPTGNPCRS